MSAMSALSLGLFGVGTALLHAAVGYLRQRGPPIAMLLAGLTPRPATQRPAGDRARLLGVGTVGAGRLAGVGGIPPRLPLQPHDPIAQDHHHPPQLPDLRVGRRHL